MNVHPGGLHEIYAWDFHVYLANIAMQLYLSDLFSKGGLLFKCKNGMLYSTAPSVFISCKVFK